MSGHLDFRPGEFKEAAKAIGFTGLKELLLDEVNASNRIPAAANPFANAFQQVGVMRQSIEDQLVVEGKLAQDPKSCDAIAHILGKTIPADLSADDRADWMHAQFGPSS